MFVKILGSQILSGISGNILWQIVGKYHRIPKIMWYILIKPQNTTENSAEKNSVYIFGYSFPNN